MAVGSARCRVLGTVVDDGAPRQGMPRLSMTGFEHFVDCYAKVVAFVVEV